MFFIHKNSLALLFSYRNLGGQNIQFDLRIFFSDGLKFNKPPTRNPFSKTKKRDFFEFLSGRTFFDQPKRGNETGRLLRACDYYERGSSFMDVIEAEDLGMPGGGRLGVQKFHGICLSEVIFLRIGIPWD